MSIINEIELFLLNLRNPRVHAALRSDYPLLAFLPGLIIGQCVAMTSSTGAVFAIVLLLMKLAYRPKKTILLAAILTGLLSALPTYGRHAAKVQLNNETTYLVSVLDTPRMRRTNLSEFKLEVRGQLSPLLEGEHKITLFKQNKPKIICKSVSLPWRNSHAAGEGDLFLIRARHTPLSVGSHFGSYASYLRRHGYGGTCKIIYATGPLKNEADVFTKLRRAIVAAVHAACGDSEAGGLFLSMSIGVRDLLSVQTEEAFKRTGLAHLLVVSGYQVTLVFYLLFAFIRRMTARIAIIGQCCIVSHFAAACALFAAIAFVLLTGIDGASLRAAAALVFVVAGLVMERGGGMLNSILLALLSLALFWPGSYFEPGLQLTFAALAGINVGLNNRSGSALRVYLQVCLYASLFTSIVVLGWFEQISLIGFLLNPLIAPAASVVSCKGGFAAIALQLTGLDPHALGIRAIVAVTEIFRRGIITASEIPFAALTPDGSRKYIAMLLLALCITGVIIGRFNQYILRNNLALLPRRFLDLA